METVLTLMCIQYIIVFITDISGIWFYVREWISLYLSNGKSRNLDVDLPHILVCSQCQTWWAGLLYLLIVGDFTFGYIAFVAFLAMMTSVTCEFMLNIIDYLKR